MKGLGTLLIVAGIVAVCFSIYGFIEMNNSGFSASLTDQAIDVFNALGGGSALTSGQSFQLFVVRNRVVLGVAGIALAAIGGLLRKKRTA